MKRNQSMDGRSQLEALLELADQLGLEVRRAALGGDGGGACSLRGKDILFVDTQADLEHQLEATARALAGHPALEQQFVLPEIRELLGLSG